MEAYDDGIPSKVSLATSTVTINILRNQQCPRFTPPFGGFVGTVREDESVGTEVATITAQDNDNPVGVIAFIGEGGRGDQKDAVLQSWTYSWVLNNGHSFIMFSYYSCQKCHVCGY